MADHSAAIPSTEFRFTSIDGLRVACVRWDSRPPVRGVVQIAHGMGEHIGRYVETIAVLVSAGLTVYGNDHRGHGRTAPTPKHFGDFGEGGFDLLVENMLRLSRIAKEENAGKPFMLLGHSMGSFAAQQFALDDSPEIVRRGDLGPGDTMSESPFAVPRFKAPAAPGALAPIPGGAGDAPDHR
jgi:alpha-beta hydrolase superfamily lysophospholipase